MLGSVSGASAAIATTWISQKSQTVRERAKWKTRKHEAIYGDFITEALTTMRGDELEFFKRFSDACRLENMPHSEVRHVLFFGLDAFVAA